MKVHEKFSPKLLTTIPPGDVVPFWTLNASELMVLVAGKKGKASSSAPFNFKRPDNTVLQFDNTNEASCYIEELSVQTWPLTGLIGPLIGYVGYFVVTGLCGPLTCMLAWPTNRH